MKRCLDYVAVGVLCVGSMWLGTLTYHNHWGHRKGRSPASAPAPRALIVRTLAGQSQALDTRVLDQPTLLLVLSVDCRFCQNNAQNWRELVAALRESDSPTQVIALSLSSATETRRFLADHDLEVPAYLIDRGETSALGLRGVPTTVALDPGSQMLRTWAGVLNETEMGTILTWARTS